ncbi:hypothetical protein LZD49_04600 [Dyadobacter sp. CY261]|uniref:SIS domain-containing protein n=1 Tax=Dyadobacter sp. CY261 TaxID=2907203 RepID=UPI001F23B5B4|nr:hypothetical protein [Dyadobacter sp. CY261]MCF0069740.1 hypothetical protein [Dyadobacter sp. CY261]
MKPKYNAMNPMLSEILEIPQKALQLLTKPVAEMPLHVKYLGMGSSYFAPLAFKYMGFPVEPEMASEYYHYLSGAQKQPLAVILSQSGKSSEALWCSRLFERYIAITNYAENALAQAENVERVAEIGAGPEQYSSSKTYINTLLVLFRGLGLDPSAAVQVLAAKMAHYQQQGKSMADEIHDKLTSGHIHGIYITGSGPNIATAFQAALILSESTKLNFNGLPMAQYDHGPKETAKDSIVIQIMAKGNAYERTAKLSETIRRAGAFVLTVEEAETEENFSVLHNIVPFNFVAYYLAEKLGVGETFTVGGKVTEVQ